MQARILLCGKAVNPPFVHCTKFNAGMPPFKVGQRTAEVDAYFLGTADNAPLIELQLKIRGCVENEADQWMRQRFGAPIETKGPAEFWKTATMWAGAWLPSEPGRCLVHLLPLSENAEIDRIKRL